MTPTRGERNNNPGNLERNYVKWLGMTEIQPDPRFICFATPEDGIRALGKLMLSYYQKYRLNTVRTIIDRYAPPHENDTGAYVDHVAKLLSVNPDEAIDPTKPATLGVLVTAIIQHENGRCVYSDETICKAVDRALS